MNALLLILALGVSTPAKMFVSTANGVTFTDYPSMARCEVAKEQLLTAWHRAQDNAMPGYKVVQYAPLTVLCIPG
jgi:hypothetical protein